MLDVISYRLTEEGRIALAIGIAQRKLRQEDQIDSVLQGANVLLWGE